MARNVGAPLPLQGEGSEYEVASDDPHQGCAMTSPFRGRVDGTAAACCGYSLILDQWICSSRDGNSPSGVRICT